VIPPLADEALAAAATAPGIRPVTIGGPLAPLSLLRHPAVWPRLDAALGPGLVLDSARLLVGAGLPPHPPLFAGHATPAFALRLAVGAAETRLADVREPLPPAGAQVVLTYARPWFSDDVSALGVVPFAIGLGTFLAADAALQALLARAAAALAQRAPAQRSSSG
jgi:hypothetical protein